MTMLRPITVLLLALAIGGCSGTFEEARLQGAPHEAVSIDPPECAAIDTARRNWGAIAKGTAVAAGASGVSAIPVSSTEGRWALVSAGVVLGIFSAISQVEADGFAASWVRQCGATAFKPVGSAP